MKSQKSNYLMIFFFLIFNIFHLISSAINVRKQKNVWDFFQGDFPPFEISDQFVLNSDIQTVNTILNIEFQDAPLTHSWDV